MHPVMIYLLGLFVSILLFGLTVPLKPVDIEVLV